METDQHTQLYHAHVQHPKGSGYMMQTGAFKTVKDAVKAYLVLVDKDSNPFGRDALLRNPEPLRVTLIPAELRGPDVMSAVGFCNVWDENGDDMYKTDEPNYVLVENPRYQAEVCYDVQDVIDAEITLEPMKCRHCSVVGETTYHDRQGDAYCATCGKWQLQDG